MNTSFHEQLFSMGNQSLKMTTGKCLSATHSHAQYWSVAAGCRNHATTNLNGELLYADETDGGGKGGSRGGHVSSWGADRIRHVEYSCALMTLAVSAAGCRPECQGYYGGRARFNTETYTHPNTYTHTHTHIKREREREYHQVRRAAVPIWRDSSGHANAGPLFPLHCCTRSVMSQILAPNRQLSINTMASH